jgi:hypothetical protein
MVEPGGRVDPVPLTAFELGVVSGDGVEQRDHLCEPQRHGGADRSAALTETAEMT